MRRLSRMRTRWAGHPAPRVEPSVCSATAGPCGGLHLRDTRDELCWQLRLLPDSNYPASDEMLKRFFGLTAVSLSQSCLRCSAQ